MREEEENEDNATNNSNQVYDRTSIKVHNKQDITCFIIAVILAIIGGISISFLIKLEQDNLDSCTKADCNKTADCSGVDNLCRRKNTYETEQILGIFLIILVFLFTFVFTARLIQKHRHLEGIHRSNPNNIHSER